MPTPTTEQKFPTLSNGSIGSPADGKSISNTNVLNSQVTPVSVKYVDANEFDGDRGGDTRSQNTGATTTDAFKSQNGPRGETTETELEGA